MKWKIYDKTGKTLKCEVHKIEYNGEFMGQCNITCSISSATPIAFAIGDYLDYRGERFYINYDPSVIKSSSIGSSGEAFKYEDVVLNSAIDELTRCSFLDYVKSDNNIHYSSLPVFSFYAASVKDLADRLQVNLDRIYTGAQKWTVNVHPQFAGEINQNIDINNSSVWDALSLVKTTFKGNFIVRGRTITIGTEGVSANRIFKYGKGNGLTQIERSSESDQAIITRLRVYGSDKNMPPRYYATLFNPFVECPILEVGIVGLGEGQVKLLLRFDFKLKFRSDTQIYTARINGADFRIGKHPSDEMCAMVYCGVNEQWDTKITKGSIVRFDNALVDTTVPAKYKVPRGTVMPNNMAINRLMLPGFPDKTLDPYIDSKNIDILGIREGVVFFDGTGENEEIFPTIVGMTKTQLDAAGVIISLDAGDNGNLDEVVSADQITDSGVFDDSSNKEIPPFKITIKDIGFSIADYNAGSASISMKDGMCGGRDFEIVKCEKQGNKYVLTCNRVHDSSLKMYFPYKDYNIKPKDKFVLLGINMPDVYVKASSEKLLEAGKEFLAKNDFSKHVYSPKVDDVLMARQHDSALANGEVSLHDTLKEGDLLLFEDADLHINGNIIIDTLSITEGDSLIPHYEVTLRDEKNVGTIEKMQQQIDSLSSVHGGGANVEQITALIKAIGKGKFLSKVSPDQTSHLIKFLAGAQFGEAIDSLVAGKGTIITSDGRIQADSIEVRNSLTALEVIFNRISAMESDYTFSDSGTIEAVTTMPDGTYKLKLRKRWENDFTSLQANDILYGFVNDLAKNGSFYTSWVRVVSVDQASNTIDVSLYPDSEVPGGKNYPPEELMILTRRGNPVNTDRQNFWYLSTNEGCLCMLDGVTKPILEESNYSVIVGRLKRLSLFTNLPINYRESYVYCRGLLANNYTQIEKPGVVVRTENNRGFWNSQTAISNPYKNGLSTYDVVSHYGCEWACLTSGTTQEPKFGCTDWAMVRGNPEFSVTIISSEGWGEFDTDTFRTTLSVEGKLYNQDVSDKILAEDVTWSRDSGNVSEDNAWNTTHAKAGKTISLTPDDLPPDKTVLKRCKFIVHVILRDGQERYKDTDVLHT